MTIDVHYGISRTYTRALSAGLTLVALVSLVGVVTLSAEAQTFTVLYSFMGGAVDGAGPTAGLIRDTAGNLYGTTAYGGSACNCGTLFKLDATGKQTVLHSFTFGADGAYPFATLIRGAAGNLYGTTYFGGMLACGGGLGCGTVFAVNTTGKYKVLHSFAGGAAGAYTYASLVRDAAGNLYGTTVEGGTSGYGTVFKLTVSSRQETVLHSFRGRDGQYPHAGLIQDAAGSLYSTTPYGGAHSSGTVFKLDATGKVTVLHSFAGGADGANPYAGLIRDAAGNLYGTNVSGGDLTCNSGAGCGVVFKLDASGKETVLHSFAGPEGAYPMGLTRDAMGNLYGTTTGGGAFDYGTVFKIDATGNETVLHSFDNSLDGANPSAELIVDANGNLYGTAPSGGAFGYGTVFKLAP